MSKYSEEELSHIMTLHSRGTSTRLIVEDMIKVFPDTWKNLNTPQKVVQRLIRKGKSSQQKLGENLNDMTRAKRFDFIKDRLDQTPRFKGVYETAELPA
jgi:hypothetical protein